MKSILVAMIAAFCTVYLMNPTWGLIELIPDNIPIVGNLDEATVTAILIACIRYFGLDWTRFFGRKGKHSEGIEDDVIDID